MIFFWILLLVIAFVAASYTNPPREPRDFEGERLVRDYEESCRKKAERENRLMEIEDAARYPRRG